MVRDSLAFPARGCVLDRARDSCAQGHRHLCPSPSAHLEGPEAGGVVCGWATCQEGWGAYIRRTPRAVCDSCRAVCAWPAKALCGSVDCGPACVMPCEAVAGSALQLCPRVASVMEQSSCCRAGPCVKSQQVHAPAHTEAGEAAADQLQAGLWEVASPWWHVELGPPGLQDWRGLGGVCG